MTSQKRQRGLEDGQEDDKKTVVKKKLKIVDLIDGLTIVASFLSVQERVVSFNGVCKAWKALATRSISWPPILTIPNCCRFPLNASTQAMFSKQTRALILVTPPTDHIHPFPGSSNNPFDGTHGVHPMDRLHAISKQTPNLERLQVRENYTCHTPIDEDLSAMAYPLDVCTNTPASTFGWSSLRDLVFSYHNSSRAFAPFLMSPGKSATVQRLELKWEPRPNEAFGFNFCTVRLIPPLSFMLCAVNRLVSGGATTTRCPTWCSMA